MTFAEMRSGLEEWLRFSNVTKTTILLGFSISTSYWAFRFGEIAPFLEEPLGDDHDFPSPPEAFAELYFGTPATADESSGESVRMGVGVCASKMKGSKSKLTKKTFMFPLFQGDW